LCGEVLEDKELISARLHNIYKIEKLDQCLVYADSARILSSVTDKMLLMKRKINLNSTLGNYTITNRTYNRVRNAQRKRKAKFQIFRCLFGNLPKEFTVVNVR